MHVLQREVGRNQQLVTSRHAQHGAVVSDPGYDRSTGANPAPDPLDQRFLSHWRQAPNYTSPQLPGSGPRKTVLSHDSQKGSFDVTFGTTDRPLTVLDK
jgi:hypothetical protein